jgi:hypothetical protein
MGLGNILVFAVFSLIPFLGGNHLPLFYLSIDRFWIESTFGLLLPLAITFVYFRNRVTASGFSRFLVFFCPFWA